MVFIRKGTDAELCPRLQVFIRKGVLKGTDYSQVFIRKAVVKGY